ncbi:KRAB-A domain-containing protein 2-like [Mytilus edulis]|uniref:KRAB-A domain-containing protein 2-like n=1 Tax=Mytilus edulis TaxID=6550 RepID=UPI0039EF0169
MQSMPNGDFKFILNYQDNLTKFGVIECLSSKRAAEVAYKLFTNVFLVFGAPHILQSDNGREFTANIILELKQLWPELVIVHGKPRHPQSQGSVERSNGDVHDMLVSWMRDNVTTKWATGIKFLQFQKNRRNHSGIKRSPYEAMFGCPPKVGLASSPIPTKLLETLQQEEDLNFEMTTRHHGLVSQSSKEDLVAQDYLFHQFIR